VFIPDPVTPEFGEGKLGSKEKTVITFGRWDDYQQKNTAVMVKTAIAFVKARPDYRFIVFGGGTDKVNAMFSAAPKSIRERIEVLGFVERPKIKELLGNAQMFFVPSRWESFSIASGEALCMGCSVVGTPLESLYYLTTSGFSGTLTANFKASAILEALLEDAQKWDSDKYNSQGIADFWRPRLNRKAVAKSIADLAQEKLGIDGSS